MGADGASLDRPSLPVRAIVAEHPHGSKGTPYLSPDAQVRRSMVFGVISDAGSTQCTTARSDARSARIGAGVLTTSPVCTVSVRVHVSLSSGCARTVTSPSGAQRTASNDCRPSTRDSSRTNGAPASRGDGTSASGPADTPAGGAIQRTRAQGVAGVSVEVDGDGTGAATAAASARATASPAASAAASTDGAAAAAAGAASASSGAGGVA